MQQTYSNYQAKWVIECEGKTYDFPEGLKPYILDYKPWPNMKLRNATVRSRVHIYFDTGYKLDIRLMSGPIIHLTYTGKPIGFVRDLLSQEP